MLRCLLSYAEADGLYPADAAVAADSGYSISTVRRARMDARDLGLLTWERTRKLVGGRWVQGTNRYTIHLPSRPVCERAGRRRGRHRRRRFWRRQ